MDQELIAYLDERFRESSRQIEGLRQETMSRFEQVDEAIQQNRDESRHTQNEVRRTQDGVRHTQIMVEALRSDLQGVAEGVLGANQRIDALREEMKQEVGKVHHLVDLPHKDHRDVNERVRSLEEWRKRMSEDPAPRLRKKSGKKS